MGEGEWKGGMGGVDGRDEEGLPCILNHRLPLPYRSTFWLALDHHHRKNKFWVFWCAQGGFKKERKKIL